MGAVHQYRRNRRKRQTQTGFPAGNAGVGTQHVPRDEEARSFAVGRGQFALQRRSCPDRPEHMARLSSGLSVGGDDRAIRRQHVSRFDPQLHRRQPPRGRTDVQQRVRQRVGLQRKYRRCGFHLGLSHHDERFSFTPESVRLALYRTPRRDQRMERLCEIRPFTEDRRPQRSGTGYDDGRLPQPLLYSSENRPLQRCQRRLHSSGSAGRFVYDRQESGRAHPPHEVGRMGSTGTQSRVRAASIGHSLHALPERGSRGSFG